MVKQKENKNLPVKWDEEMARQAQVAADMENSVATGQFFSTQGGVLSWNGMPMPNNMMAVIILDSILENVYYTGNYDPENPQGPTCFAFGRDDASLAPHKVIVENGTAQSDVCRECRWNEWGTADRGKGKACKNIRRLALISAGNLDAQGTGKMIQPFGAEELESGQIGFFKLAVTSVKGYAAYVKQVAGALKRPPYGVYTLVRVVPDPKSQFKTQFMPLGLVPTELLPIVMKRHEEAIAGIDFPYLPADEAPVKVKQQNKKTGGKSQAGRKKY